MTKGNNPLVQILMKKFIKGNKFLIKYSKKEDKQGITNVKNAQRRVVEATINYIKENNL
jgi:hypothetical protein